ncbi:MAG: hypothetical protein J6S97_01595 [Bacteroidales bacterium]|nr:hypothetical protein [Bacteroidales bacterium]
MVYEAVIGYFSYGFSLKVLLFFSLSSLSFPVLASTFFRGQDDSRIAIDKGLIGGVDDEVLSYFPEYQVKRGEKTIYGITLKLLLTMRAPYKGKGDPWSKVCSSLDWTKTSLDFLGGRNGIIGEFNYKTVCLHILSGSRWQLAYYTYCAILFSNNCGQPFVCAKDSNCLLYLLS